MRTLGLWAAVGPMLGCLSLDRETPIVRTYGLTVVRDRAEGGQGTLGIGRVDVSPRFAQRAFVYRQNDVLYEADPYHIFLADPGVLVREEATRWLRNAGLFSHVGDLPTPDLRLDLDVEAFYGDYREGASPKAVLELRALARGIDGRPLLDRTYAAEERLRDVDRATLVRGWEGGLERILGALTADLRRIRPLPIPPAD